MMGKKMEPLEQMEYAGPIGTLRLTAQKEGLLRVELVQEAQKGEAQTGSGCAAARAVLQEACAQLDEYFAGTRREFAVPLAERGTEFQRQVWQALRTIPYGQTRSYRQIAEQIGKPKAARAVGAGCGRNPLLLFTPCHRVIGSSGALTGFACGLAVKAQLLIMEELFSEREMEEKLK